MAEPWWKSAVVYQIYPRSFSQSPGGAEARRQRYAGLPPDYPTSPLTSRNDDGVGDLDGIRQRLDHIRDLGADAIWISPFFTSPMKDYGYDVSDYEDVDPLFGTLDDFDRLLEDAHQKNIKVLIDWVPNHTSDQHPWFVESRSSRTNPKADWYWWRDPEPGDTDHTKPPNNWIAAFTGGPPWTFDDTRQQWYLHNFLKEQPDLNWHNPEVVEAMHGTLRFWLDRGVDGFRIDVVHLMGKTQDLPDGTLDEVGNVRPVHDYQYTHQLLRDIRTLMDSYGTGASEQRMMVGEVYLLSTKRVATYYGQDDELHLSFNFPPLHAPWTAAAWRKRIERVVEELDPRNAWPSWVISNHDQPRHRTRYGSEAKARAAAVQLLTLRGTPFLYAGEELGLEDAVIPPSRVLDPGGRDGCRAPYPWTPAPDHGWGTDDPWLPWPPDPDTNNAESERADDTSVLSLYRRLLAERHASPALALGAFAFLDDGVPPDVIAYERTQGDDRRVVLVNYADTPQPVTGFDDGLTVVLTSDGQPFDGRTLAPDQAALLRP